MRWCLNCDLKIWREELAFQWEGRQAENARLMTSIVSFMVWLESRLWGTWDKERIFAGMAGKVE